MADYTTLKNAIKNAIKQNENNEITGPILQEVLLAMVNSLGVGYQFVGLATPETEPGTPDQNIFYIAGPGTYPNFDGLEIPVGQIGVMSYNGEWDSELLEIPSDFINVNSLAVHPSAYSNRAAAIADVPSSARKAGLVITYMTDEKWVVEQYIGASWTADDANWKAIKESDIKMYSTLEPGFHVVDNNRKIGLRIDGNGFDVAKVTEHFLQLIGGGSVFNSMIGNTAEAGFFIVDSNLKIGVKVDNSGIHAINMPEFSIVEL